MIKVLLIGEGSYIGNEFISWMSRYADSYTVDVVDTKSDAWENKDFKGYDVAFQVAGIAHVKQETEELKDLFYEVNEGLTYELAQKAKQSGIGQYIFMSTKGVYASFVPHITRDTQPNPPKLYGKSKLAGEKRLAELEDEKFKVAIVRSAAVYGKNAPGHYRDLVKFAKKTKIFPYIKTRRSMIYVKNLCEFIKCVIENHLDGVLFPQDKEFTCSSEVVKCIGEIYNKKIFMSRLLGLVIAFFEKRGVYKVRKAFASTIYDPSMSDIGINYCKYTIRQALEEMLAEEK